MKENGRLAGISTDTVTKQAGHVSEEKPQTEHESEPLQADRLEASTLLCSALRSNQALILRL